ncbi:helix-turn-helix domain-containing protein [Sphingomonas sp. MMS24-J45]|uniref:helix-turn-helix domain-containing protein n=1 Tax=Sphingomonas sp. MMS24-J45 TaxID=3238806 RepID=UPI00384CCD75
MPSYAVLDSEEGFPHSDESWMLPSWAMIWIILAEAPISVSVGNRRYPKLSTAILYGVTSRAMPVISNGGVTIAIDISPLGWARFFRESAETLRDRVTPLEEVLPAELVEELVNRLYYSDRSLEVKGILDDIFTSALPPEHRDEPMIADVMKIVMASTTTDLAASAAKIGIQPLKLRRLSQRYFGFPPKILLMRARFIRVFLEMMISPDDAHEALLSSVYFDRSHFLRDAKRFLGMTPRQFMDMNIEYLTAALRARRLVLGVSTPSLDMPPPAEEASETC